MIKTSRLSNRKQTGLRTVQYHAPIILRESNIELDDKGWFGYIRMIYILNIPGIRVNGVDAVFG